MDEEKDFDLLLDELKNKEYECMEIKSQKNNTLTTGYWEKSYTIDKDGSKYESIYNYKFYDDGTFEKNETINHTYSNSKSDWETPYQNTTTQKGFYIFDGDIIYSIVQYGSSGIVTLKYDNENDTIGEYNKETDIVSDKKYIRYNN